MPNIFVDISSHGFGHLAQSAPILNALADRLPDCRLMIRSGLPRDRIAARLKGPFVHQHAASDFGYVMFDPMRIDLKATADRYREVHADWAAMVRREAQILREIGAEFVLTNVAYLPLAGAALTGIPAAAFCSLNWSELFEHFFGNEQWAEKIGREISAAYRSAPFLALEPAMPMAGLSDLWRFPPVAETGTLRRAELAACISARQPALTGLPIVLVGFGGIAMDTALFDLAASAHRARAQNSRCCWLVPDGWAAGDPDCLPSSELGLSFSDLLASCDAVITKPGYGTFVEAACAGTPVLWLRREEWPEQDCLIDWLDRQVASRELLPEEMAAGLVPEALNALWRLPERARPLPDGAGRVADDLLARILKYQILKPKPASSSPVS